MCYEKLRGAKKTIVRCFSGLLFVFAMILGVIPGINTGMRVLAAIDNTVDLSTLTGNYVAQDGNILTGTLPKGCKLTIADGAKVTFNNITIPCYSSNSWAAVTCEGDATITLTGENSVESSNSWCPGVFVRKNKTLTIQGTGTLNATGGQYSPGIGSGDDDDNFKSGNIVIQSGTINSYAGNYGAAGIGASGKGNCGDITISGGVVNSFGSDQYGAGIGAGYQSTCGDITISGGMVHAYAGRNEGSCGGAGIGTSGYNSTCGDITISGGAVYAFGAKDAAGIGCGKKGGNSYKTKCGAINVTSGANTVSATRGSEDVDYIGMGLGSESVSVTIDAGLKRNTDGNTQNWFKSDQIVAVADNVTCEYDGKAHGIKINVINPTSGTTIKYGTSEETCNQNQSPTITNVKESPLKVYYEVTKSGYTSITGVALVNIVRATPSKPSVPIASEVTFNSVTLIPIEGCEYGIEYTYTDEEYDTSWTDVDWQDSNVFTGLSEGTSYTFCQRYKYDDNHFSSDESYADIRTQKHEHEWEYTAEGAVITATCKNTDACHKGSLASTLTINKPLHEALDDGKEAEATITGSIDDITTPTIIYKEGSAILPAAPTDPGVYIASISLGGVTASVEYEILGREPSVTVVPVADDITYGQKLGNSSLTGGVGSIKGQFTWKDPSIKPTVADSNKTEYDVLFIPEDESYRTLTIKVKLTVNKADKPSELPAGTRTVNSDCEKVGDVDLIEGWEWKASDKDKVLPEGEPFVATAVYAGDDKGNYKTESVEVVITRLKSAHTHTPKEPVKENEVAATCEADGSYDSVVYCSICNAKISSETKTIEKLGHQLGTWTVEKPATETEKGLEKAVCQREGCTHFETREIPKLTHTHTGGKATCSHKAVCETCNEEYGELDPANHEGETVTKENEVAATCDKEGSYEEVTKCTVCEAEIKRETKNIEALGHLYGEPEYKWSDDGKQCTATVICEREGCDETVKDHIITETVDTTGVVKEDSTTEKKGITTYTATFEYEGFESKKLDVEDIEVKSKTDNTSDKPTEKTDNKQADKTAETPVNKPAETQSDKPVVTTTPSVKSEGTDLWVPDSKAEVVVTSKTGEEPTVEYKGTTDTDAKEVTVPDAVTVDGVTYKVTSIAKDAFKGNKTVEKIIIKESVKEIGAGAFEGCSKLNTVTLGNNVETIGNKAFANCKSLTKIVIPKSTKKIGNYAFKGNKKLKTIIVKTTKLTKKTVAKHAFSGVGSKVTIKVPKSKKKAYTKLFRKKGLSKKVKIK